jgi:hypothetical protein
MAFFTDKSRAHRSAVCHDMQNKLMQDKSRCKGTSLPSSLRGRASLVLAAEIAQAMFNETSRDCPKAKRGAQTGIS